MTVMLVCLTSLNLVCLKHNRISVLIVSLVDVHVLTGVMMLLDCFYSIEDIIIEIVVRHGVAYVHASWCPHC
jgi:hypothetical protein